MTRIAVLGANGRMGRAVLHAALASDDLQVVAAITRESSASIGVDAGTLVGMPPCGVALAPLAASQLTDAEVVIDFSLPPGLLRTLPMLGHRALISGTTGLNVEESSRVLAQAAIAPVLQAANFSTGVHVLHHLVKVAAQTLANFDAEVIETHHNQKRDAPSGTALFLAGAVAEARHQRLGEALRNGRSGHTGARPGSEIGMHAVRGGDVVGEHTVGLFGPGEHVRLEHVATSRETFARGALRAARWIAGRPAGNYTMADVLGLTS
jgi:4-hydroxy-tetrahydrodipicolinate reductase